MADIKTVYQPEPPRSVTASTVSHPHWTQAVTKPEDDPAYLEMMRQNAIAMYGPPAPWYSSLINLAKKVF